MSETVKTLIFAAVAVIAVVAAVLTYPKQEEYQPPDMVGKSMFETFTDPGNATELAISKFSEDLGQLTEFEVVRNAAGLWTIPSSSNYPADADAQMRDAATSLIDLKVLGVASRETKDHQVYGVIEPNREKLEASQEGVGLRVVVKNAKGDELAKLIIGKRVKGTEDQYFVRKPGEPQVYVVKVDPEKFPTEFEKWIERNLLKINTLDIERVTLKDYSIVTTQTLAGPRGKIEERFEARVTWSSDQSKWTLDELVQFRDGARKPTELLPTEELNTQKLNDLKTALGDMKIVGVLRKPTGLGADLKAGADFMSNEESQTSLMNRGFYLVDAGGNVPEIRAAEGEVLVGLKDGVEYVLRFGEIASGAAAEGQEGKVNRYLFVTARLDESKFPPLQLEPLPGGEDAAPAAKEEAKTATDEAAKTEAGKEAPKEEKTDLELERERIRKENQRKQDERDEKLKKANTQIAELNARFADWYYIIAEDEYKKVHLGRNDLIAEKSSAAAEGFGIDALRQLETEGLQEKKPDDSAKLPPPGAMPFNPGPGAGPR
jgi:hypothetical protein